MANTRILINDSNPDWYSNTLILDHIASLRAIDAGVVLCPFNTFNRAIKKPATYKNKLLFCPDFTATQDLRSNTSDPAVLIPKIKTVFDFLKQLSSNLPKHVRIGLHIQNNHFAGVDLEFSDNEIRFSYLNTLRGYTNYDDVICELFIAKILEYFLHCNLKLTKKIDNIQCNTIDCGAMLVEWFSIGIDPNKLSSPAATPYDELETNHANHFFICGQQSKAMRAYHQQRIEVYNQKINPKQQGESETTTSSIKLKRDSENVVSQFPPMKSLKSDVRETVKSNFKIQNSPDANNKPKPSIFTFHRPHPQNIIDLTHNDDLFPQDSHKINHA